MAVTKEEVTEYVREHRSELEQLEHPWPKQRYNGRTFADFCEDTLANVGHQIVYQALRDRIPEYKRQTDALRKKR